MLDIIDTYMTNINTTPLTKEEEQKMIIKIKDGDKQAKEEFAQRNFRLVFGIAKKYFKYIKHMQPMDLIQEGNLGLVKAINTYELNMNSCFSTYATPIITQTICDALRFKNRVTYMPKSRINKCNEYIKTQKILTSQLGRIPTIEEIAKVMNTSVESARQYRLTASLANNDTYSINTQTDGGEEYTDILISDEQAVSEQIELEEMKNLLRNLKERILNERQIQIIDEKYNDYDDKEKSLADIGKKYNMTRAGARYCYAQTLKKLRTNEEIKNLIIYAQHPDLALENLKWYKEEYTQNANTSKTYLENDDIDDVIRSRK